jgi:hypothetical protein
VEDSPVFVAGGGPARGLRGRYGASEEVTRRSAVGFVQFVPSGENEKLIAQSGFHLVRHADLTDNVMRLAERQIEARQRHRDQLIELDGQERFDATLAFHTAVRQLTLEKRLSKMIYLAKKPTA